MCMQPNNLTEEQLKAKQEELERCEAFEQMSHTQGFIYQKAYYENTLKAFINDMFNKEERPITDFEAGRQQLIGLKKMFGDIEYHLGVLKHERESAKSTSK